MDTPRQPEGAGDLTGTFAQAQGRATGGTPEERARVRFTPWPSDTQLPLPVFHEGVPQREAPRADRREDRRADPCAPRVQSIESEQRVPALNIRRHLLRAVVRIGALVAADLTALGLVLTFLHVVGLEWVGATATSGVGYLLQPHGVRSFVLALVVGLAATGNYGVGDRRRDGGRIFLGCVLAAFIYAWRPLWESPVVAALEPSVLVGTLGTALVVARYVLDRVVCRHRARTRTAARTMLVGSTADCARVFMQRLVSSENGFHVLGYVETSQAEIPSDALGGVGDLEHLLQEHDADTVVLCGDLGPSFVERVMRAATVNECELMAVSSAFDMAGVHPVIIWRRGRPLLALRGEAARGRGLLLKRAFDVVAASVMLVMASPLFAALAVVVRLESPGPAIFGHLRAGRHGRFFRCLKFRSMYADAETRLYADPELFRRYVDNDFKLPPDEDPRITRVGRFLRRTSLDELPQLLNVVRGEMSLVGPRPIIREELTQYAEDQPLLLLLRPGLTGLWQVNGRSSVPYPARKYIELEYVQTWTLMRDIEILLRTVPAVLRQRGAC